MAETSSSRRVQVRADAVRTAPGAPALTSSFVSKLPDSRVSWDGSWDEHSYVPLPWRPVNAVRAAISSGSWRAVVYAGTDPLTGKARYLRETAKTHAAAEVALTRLQRQVDEDQHPKTAITVRQAITQWLEVAELEGTTRERYDDLIRLYILPTFGDLPAGKLDAELLERFYSRLHRCRELCSGRSRSGHVCRPLSTSTTRKIHYIIRGALERAVRWRHLGVNKAAMAEAPSPRRTEPDPPSAKEAAALLNAAWADPDWGLLLWLTMITGSRRGEVSALRWRHIDFDRAMLWVHRSNAQTKAGITEKETKTGQRRKAALDPGTLGLNRTGLN